MSRKKCLALFYCGMCPQTFTSKTDLNIHTQNHGDSAPPQLSCQVCGWQIDDSLALEDHKIKLGHATDQYSCDNCGRTFITPRGLKDHIMKPPGCRKAIASTASSQTSPPPRHEPPTSCDRCSNTFKTRQKYNSHRSYQKNGPCADHNYKTPPKNRVGYIDPDKLKTTVKDVLSHDYSSEVADDSDSDMPSDLSDGAQWCCKCKNRFPSMAKYNAHSLWCVTAHGSNAKDMFSRGSKAASMATKNREAIQPPLSPVTNTSHPVPVVSAPAPRRALAHKPRPLLSPIPSASLSGSMTLTCNISGCQMSFRSEPALKVHKADVHGVGGERMDLRGKGSWRLNQRVREDLKRVGLLRAPSQGPSRGRGAPPVVRLPPAPALQPTPAPQPTSRQSHISSTIRGPALTLTPPSQALLHQAPPHAPAHHATAHTLGVLPTSRNMGTPFDMEQAKYIQGKILRLLIQSNIFIHHDGKMTVCGIDWTRIGFSRRAEVVGMFEGMCHLPKALQGEYLPPPKAFQNESKIQFPASEFEASPSRDRAKPGLGVISLSCSKVVLIGNLQEVVKIAAVDLITCRILMNHFVCTSPKAEVANWRSNDTGLFNWNNMEQARQNGFRILKGWSAARSALWKFVDKETIIVGHNLRSDLDSLRMVHGRAVDIAKVAEKAARGPLSMVQVGLDSLCRDFARVRLNSDPKYGRDVLMNVFAIRELGLWVIKNQDSFERGIRQKSLEYQSIMPRTATT